MALERPKPGEAPDHLHDKDICIVGGMAYGRGTHRHDDCPRNGHVLAIITVYGVDGDTDIHGIAGPEMLAEHVAGSWALGVETYGEVGFRAHLERALHELHQQYGRRIVDLR